MYPEEEVSVSQSPAREIAENKPTTGRTSRELFKIEDQLRSVYDSHLKPLLFLEPQVVRNALARNGVFLRDDPEEALPFSHYGYYAAEGVDLPMWSHGDKQYDQVLECPRLLIASRIPSQKEFPFWGAAKTASDLGNKEGVAEFFHQGGSMLLVTLAASGELIWDWSDIDSIPGGSFHGRLVPVKYSIYELFHPQYGIITRLLNTVRGVQDPPTEKISARFERFFF